MWAVSEKVVSKVERETGIIRGSSYIVDSYPRT